MNCFASPEAMTECITIATPWVQFVLTLLGFGSVGLLTGLLWVITRWKDDHKKLSAEIDGLKTVLATVESRALVAERERDVERDKLKAVGATIAGQSAELDKAQASIADLSPRVSSVRDVCAGDSANFWARPIGTRLDTYETDLRDSIPIMLFANQKGGVGKTTLTANVAAAFAAKGERVLVVDLDYQGSLSGLMLSQSRREVSGEDFPSTAHRLIGKNLDSGWHRTAILTVDDKLQFVPAFYGFEQYERCVEYSWVIGDEPNDVRFRLAKALLSKHVQDTYRRVIIDAPPRFTLGFINGFCAATHLFVPTVVDKVSAAAVGTFAVQFKKLTPTVNPIIKFSGVVGTMTGRNATYVLPENAVPFAKEIDRVVRRSLSTSDTYFIYDAVMHRSQEISHATDAGVAYLQEAGTQPMFDKLADEIAERAPLRA